MFRVESLPNGMVRASLIEDGMETCSSVMYHPKREVLNNVADDCTSFSLDEKRYKVVLLQSRYGQSIRIVCTYRPVAKCRVCGKEGEGDICTPCFWMQVRREEKAALAARREEIRKTLKEGYSVCVCGCGCMTVHSQIDSGYCRSCRYNGCT